MFRTLYNFTIHKKVNERQKRQIWFVLYVFYMPKRKNTSRWFTFFKVWFFREGSWVTQNKIFQFVIYAS